MLIRSCRACGGRVAEGAAACPGCGCQHPCASRIELAVAMFGAATSAAVWIGIACAIGAIVWLFW